MKFSIIVPVFNSEKHIRDCLDSILNQSYTNFEVITINDGSTDNSLEILKQYSRKDSRVKVLNYTNSGVGITRRRGTHIASGDYIIFVDSDDTINPDLLSSIYSFTTKYEVTPDLIRYQCNIVGDKPNKDHNRYNYNCNINKCYSGLETLKLWSVPGKKYAVYWLFAFKRTLFDYSNNIPNLKCYEDVAFIPLLVASCKQIATIDYVGYNYTFNNPNSLTHVKTYEVEKARVADFFAAYHFAVTHFIKLANISQEYIDFFLNDYDRRLKGKFDSSDENLQKEFKHLLDKYLRHEF